MFAILHCNVGEWVVIHTIDDWELAVKVKDALHKKNNRPYKIRPMNTYYLAPDESYIESLLGIVLET